MVPYAMYAIGCLFVITGVMLYLPVIFIRKTDKVLSRLRPELVRRNAQDRLHSGCCFATWAEMLVSEPSLQKIAGDIHSHAVTPLASADSGCARGGGLPGGELAFPSAWVELRSSPANNGRRRVAAISLTPSRGWVRGRRLRLGRPPRAHTRWARPLARIA